MTVTVVAVGTVRGVLQAAVSLYEERAGRYWKLRRVEVPAGVPGRGRADPDSVRASEGERILRQVPEGSHVVVLTRQGAATDSVGLARHLEDLALHGATGVAFVVGGAFGVAPSVLERADRRLSLSAMTFPHELARLVLAEQLYRAGTICRGEPYHKG